MKFNLDTENINYIKIVYKDRDDFSHCIKASIKSLTDYAIYAIIKLDNNLVIQTPQEVDLGIASDNGIYRAKTILKYTQFEESCLYLALKTPDEVEYSQKREYFRVKLIENTTISYQENDEIKVITCQTDDISANGVKCYCEKDINFPEIVQITLHFQNKNITTNARYIRADKDGEEFKFSFNFEELKESDLDFICQVCLQKQLEAKRKTLK